VIRYAESVRAQQVILAPLQAITTQTPACEQWITFSGQVNDNIPDLSVGALHNIAKIAHNMTKVFDWLHDNKTMSIPSSQYLLNLSQSAQVIATNCAMSAIVADGNITVTIDAGAQRALSTLDAWDPVQGYQTPSNPGQLATIVMQGVSIP